MTITIIYNFVEFSGCGHQSVHRELQCSAIMRVSDTMLILLWQVKSLVWKADSILVAHDMPNLQYSIVKPSSGEAVPLIVGQHVPAKMMTWLKDFDFRGFLVVGPKSIQFFHFRWIFIVLCELDYVFEIFCQCLVQNSQIIMFCHNFSLWPGCDQFYVTSLFLWHLWYDRIIVTLDGPP